MGKHNTLSGILVIAVILIIAASTFIVVDYSSGMLEAAVAFSSNDQIAKIQACGVTPPDELYKLHADLPGLILPAIYVGFPLLMIIIAVMMFIAGNNFGSDGGYSSSETTTTTSSPHRGSGGEYVPGRRVEQTRTHKSSGRGGS